VLCGTNQIIRGYSFVVHSTSLHRGAVVRRIPITSTNRSSVIQLIFAMSLPKSTGSGDAPKHPKNLIIIREIYDSENTQDKFESELEDALISGVETIVIEPMRLGDTVARWITVGNCLHKTAVLSGMAGVICTFIWPRRTLAYTPLCSLSLAATGIYFLSWQSDPCCKYQIEADPGRLPELRNLNIGSPIVIVRKDDTRRKYLHSIISISAVMYAGWRYYSSN